MFCGIKVNRTTVKILIMREAVMKFLRSEDPFTLLLMVYATKVKKD